MHRRLWGLLLLCAVCPEVTAQVTADDATYPEPPAATEALVTQLPFALRLRAPLVPEPGWGLPEPLAAGDPDDATHAVFVRVSALTLGGNFDAAGDEEVVVFAYHEGAPDRRRLARHVLDLPGQAVATFEVRGSSTWTELPPGPLSLELEVVEEDVTEWEDMTGSREPLPLDPDALDATPHAFVVPLETIRGQAWGLGGSRAIKLKGASATLEVVRVARRDAPDADAQQLLGTLLDGVPTDGGADSAALLATCNALLGVARLGAETARRSTHTWLRATLHEQVARALRLARYARGALVAQPEVRAALWSKAEKAAGNLAPLPQAVPLQAAWQELVERLAANASLPDLRQTLERLEATLGEHQDDPAAWELEILVNDLLHTCEGLAGGPECAALLESWLPAFRQDLTHLAGR